MKKSSHADQQILGDVLLERFAAVSVPAALRPHVVEFKKIHAALVAANDAVATSRAARDAALGAVSDADDAHDAAVSVLRDKMIGASLGSRTNPFAGFTAYAPTALTNLAYAREVKEVRALCAKVRQVEPPPDVAKALIACEKRASGVEAALAKLTKPQLAYAKALAARDAVLPDWTKALARLKRNAEAVWFDDRATWKAVFAPPERVQETRRGGRSKKPAAEPPAATAS